MGEADRIRQRIERLSVPDTSSSAPPEYANLGYGGAGNLTDDKERYKYDYDVFYRCVEQSVCSMVRWFRVLGAILVVVSLGCDRAPATDHLQESRLKCTLPRYAPGVFHPITHSAALIAIHAESLDPLEKAVTFVVWPDGLMFWGDSFYKAGPFHSSYADLREVARASRELAKLLSTIDPAKATSYPIDGRRISLNVSSDGTHYCTSLQAGYRDVYPYARTAEWSACERIMRGLIPKRDGPVLDHVSAHFAYHGKECR